MKTRLTTDEKRSIVDRLKDKQLYNYLHTFCPTYERKLDTVRPSTEEILVEAMDIIDNIIAMSQNEVSMYCDGRWDDIYNQWREATEAKTNTTPKDEHLFTTASLIMFTVMVFMNACSSPNSLSCALSIAARGDILCRDQFNEVQATFMQNLKRALDNGLQQWVLDYAAGSGGLFVDEQPQPSFDSSITLRSGRTKEEGRGNKVNLYRVVMALHRMGFFKRKDNAILDDKDVFNSFGAMLGLNFGKYLDDLGTDKVHNLDGVKIFKELEEAYAEYVSEKDKEEDDR